MGNILVTKDQHFLGCKLDNSLELAETLLGVKINRTSTCEYKFILDGKEHTFYKNDYLNIDERGDFMIHSNNVSYSNEIKIIAPPNHSRYSEVFNTDYQIPSKIIDDYIKNYRR